MTTLRAYDVIEEPRGETLHRLLRVLRRYASHATLVLRDGLGLEEAAQSFLAALRPHLVKEKRSSSWPGTTLLNEEATVLRFELNQAVVEALIAAGEGLFDWKQPSLPEDLALLRDDGSPILVAISHEQDAYLDLTDDEYDGLLGALPELERLVRLTSESSQ